MALKLCPPSPVPSSPQEILAHIREWDSAVQRAMKGYAAAKLALDKAREPHAATLRFKKKAEELHQALANRHHYQTIADQMRKPPFMLRA
ncbi:hypothetical protein [Teichococcus deserti]|uniref:hypothetical protein n=1 Tax=Teichococcus deserti TaxID=1817963 RepID=UPI00105464D2|nr:hypothetical protein [Pseudoroseomonas deserti]